MNPKIKINQIFDKPSWRFNIIIEDEKGKTQHSVSMSKDFYKSLDLDIEPWKIINETFRFLLVKEPKESILKEFDITIVSYYFPEFKEEFD